MATRAVRFEFYCDDDTQLKFTHQIPRSLVDNALTSRPDPDYNNKFTSAVFPITRQHAAACRTAAPTSCRICKKMAAGILQMPMSWLHNQADPFVAVWIHALCTDPECEKTVRQRVNETMSSIAKNDSILNFGPLACNICGKKGDLKQCSRCKQVNYCGTDHQKADWRSHKKYCTAA